MTKVLSLPQASAEAELGREAKASGAQDEQFLTVQALRFVAAFAVVALHATIYSNERLSPPQAIYHDGANGVRLFFVISGFVMMVSSLRLVGTPLGWRYFAAKRLIRIVPMYWLITTFKLATMLAVPAVVVHVTLDWSVVAKSYLFWPAGNADGIASPLLGVGWTLNFEMAFYALFALALLLRLPPLAFIAPILLAASAASLLETRDWPIPVQFWCDPIVLDFLAGMLLARTTMGGWKLSPSAGAFAVLVGLAYIFLPLLPRPGAYGTMAFSLAMTVASTIVVAGAIALEKQIGRRIPAFVLFLGAASYSLYLVHPVVAPSSPAVLARLGIEIPLLGVLGSLAIALVASGLAYRYIEQPLTDRLNGVARTRGLFFSGTLIREATAQSKLRERPAPTLD